MDGAIIWAIQTKAKMANHTSHRASSADGAARGLRLQRHCSETSCYKWRKLLRDKIQDERAGKRRGGQQMTAPRYVATSMARLTTSVLPAPRSIAKLRKARSVNVFGWAMGMSPIMLRLCLVRAPLPLR